MEAVLTAAEHTQAALEAAVRVFPFNRDQALGVWAALRVALLMTQVDPEALRALARNIRTDFGWPPDQDLQLAMQTILGARLQRVDDSDEEHIHLHFDSTTDPGRFRFLVTLHDQLYVGLWRNAPPPWRQASGN